MKKTILILTLAMATGIASAEIVDRPGDLLELAEQLTINIQTAESVRDEILQEIDVRSQKLKDVEQKLLSPGLAKPEKLELLAQKNRLERDENKYRRQALGVVKEQMDNVFTALEDIRAKLQDMQGEEAVADPQVVNLFNKYFRVSAQLIQSSTDNIGMDAKTVEMLETLEKSMIVSKKSTDFLVKAEDRIKEYQKIVALYNARLTYLARGLEAHGDKLTHEKDSITIVVTLETAERFMLGLDTDGMEDRIMRGLDNDPLDYMDKYGPDKNINKRVSSKKKNRKMLQYMEGKALKP
jgi:hypothetical protein